MQPICTKRTPLDSTESILFEIAPREVTLKATDLEVSLQCSASIESSITEPASFLISGKRVYEVIKELDGTITFTISDKAVQITAQDGVSLSLSIKDAHDFPPFPERIENLMQMESSLISELLAKVAFLVPSNNANPALNGMLLECSSEGLSMVATDGHCLARIITKKYTLAEAHSWLIPKRAVMELKKVLEGYTAGTGVFLGICSGYLVFSGTNFNFFTRLIAEPFPNYAPILNKEGFYGATVSRDHFIKSMKRAACLLAGQFISTSFQFNSEHKSLEVKLENKEVGTLEESIVLNGYEGDAIKARFYTPYLLNGLQVVADKQVNFHVMSDARPFVLSTSGDEYEFTYLVMPVSASAQR
jgi:DNA polymerase-3 subunit beta